MESGEKGAQSTGGNQEHAESYQRLANSSVCVYCLETIICPRCQLTSSGEVKDCSKVRGLLEFMLPV
jgi:hypothetical protein